MSILHEAEKLVHGDRHEVYGHPLQDFQRVAGLWQVILGVPLTPQQVGLCLLGLKMARECHGHQRDTLVDIAGYAECLQMIADTLEGPCPTPIPSVPAVAPPWSQSVGTGSVPSAMSSPSPVVKGEPGTCPQCHLFLPHVSLGRTHQCVVSVENETIPTITA